MNSNSALQKHIPHVHLIFVVKINEKESMTLFSFSHQKVDFSCNQISKMRDLSAYQALTKLILDSILWLSKGENLVSNVYQMTWNRTR